jgi:ligand-binding sensor domain-containing protein/class 3 adenylate cyclase
MRKLNCFVLISAVWLLTHTAVAQRFFFDNLGVQQGLPASKVYAVLEDVDGRIWIGTEAGLSRYDGVNVESFGPESGVASNGARSLFRDKYGRIWAGHLGGGISVFDGQRFTALRLDGTALSSDITGIAQDRDGHIWLTSFGEGAVQVSELKGDGSATSERYGMGQGLDNRLVGITALRDGTLCFLDASGKVQRLDASSDTFSAMLLPGLPDLHRVTALYEDSENSLWVGTFTGGAYMLSSKGGQPKVYDIGTGMPSNFVFSFGEDAQGRVWVGTWDGGAARIQPDGIRVFTPGNGLHDKAVRCILRDREGNMLLGTNENGLDIFKGERFVTFTDADGLIDPQVWAVMEDPQGRIWFGTNGGISILDAKEGSTSRVRNLTTQQGELTSNRVRCLVTDASGMVWIGTDNGGLLSFDPRTFRFKYYTEISGSIPENKVTALAVGKNGALWVGTINGLVRFVPDEVPMVYRTEDGLSGTNVTALYRDPQNILWVGSALRGVTRVENAVAKPLDIGRSFTATCFVQDGQGRLWIGTEGQGVFVVEKGKVVATYTTEEGLISNVIKSLNADRSGHVWIGSNRGLNAWDPNTNAFVSYTERAGFVGIEAKANSTCLTRSGNLWFGTANGAAQVSVLDQNGTVNAPVIGFRGLRINLEDRPLEDGFRVGHADRNIRIAYGSVSLSDPAAVQYRYMLAGLEKEWQPLTKETDAHYPALPPGSYTFLVKAQNRAGLWSDPPAELHFTILPPWYKSWWFYTALVLVVGISLFSYIKVRERQLRLRNIVLERKVEERTAEVVAQSKEIEGQKGRIEDLLLNILPKEISEELKEKGKATARRHEEVSVMFTDMKGFTQAAEKMTPEELVNELDECFIGFDEIVGRYGIEKIKTIGDSYMCAAGVPTSDEHHALKCTLAALEVRELMNVWRKQRESLGKTPWILRIGVHTGPVVAGVVGKRKFAYDIWGDTVNTASRMESSGEPGEVNVSGATYALVKDHFECEHRGQIAAKNKGAIDMYFVRRIKAGWCSDPQGQVPNARFLKEVGISLPVQQFA